MTVTTVGTLESFADVSDVPDGLWESLRPESIYTTREWCVTLRRSNPDVPIEVWAVRDGAGWLAAIPVHVYPGVPARSTYDLWQLHDDAFAPAPGSGYRERTHLLIGTRNGQRNGFLVAPDRAAGGVKAELVRAVQRSRPDAVTSLLYCDRTMLTELSALRPEWHVLFADASAEVPVPPGATGIEDFIQSVTGTVRRQIRVDLRRFSDEPVIRVTDPDAIARLAPVLAPLLVNVHERHGQQAAVASLTQYLRSCARPELSPVVFVVGDLADPVAFELSVVIGDMQSARVLGLDHERVRERNVEDYARVSFHEPLRYAIERGVRAVEMGVGSLDGKLFRGARAVPLYTIARLPDDLAVDVREADQARRIADLRSRSIKLAADPSHDWVP